jgi:hypothetical protein
MGLGLYRVLVTTGLATQSMTRVRTFVCSSLWAMRTEGIDAEFHLESHIGDTASFDIILKSRGGKIGSSSARNPEYNQGLEEILSRLSLVNVHILNIEVDSAITRSMPPEQRRLELDFPISLRQISDFGDLRRKIGRAQTSIGREPGTRSSSSGNSTKQIRIQIASNPRLPNLESAENLLGQPDPPQARAQGEDHLEPNDDPDGPRTTKGELRTYERRQIEPTEVHLLEKELVRRYKSFLNSQGQEHTVRRTGEQRELEVDLINVTTDELIEAKSAADRDHIRYAIGQLRDYGRYLEPATQAILLPERPSSDLLELIKIAGLVCIFEETIGAFRRIEA